MLRVIWKHILCSYNITSDLHSFSETRSQPEKTNPEQWQDAVEKELKKIKANNYENWFSKQNNKKHAPSKTSYDTQI